jgi:hypothetical protein
LTLDTTTSVGKVILQAERIRGYQQNLALIPLVMPQNWHLANYSIHATIRTLSLWKRTTKQNMHVSTYTLCGWNQDSNVTQVHDGTHKRIYNNHEDSTSQESKYIQRFKSYLKQNSIRVQTRIQMGLRGLKITMASITLPRPSRKGNLANVVASMYLSSNLLQREIRDEQQ